MAKGIESKVVKYILASDEGVPDNELTVFHINQLSYLAAAESTRRNIRATKMDLKGETDMDVSKWKKAKREDFIEIVVEVENYHFGYKYSDIQRRGWIDFKDHDTRMKMLDDLHGDHVRELIDAGNGTFEGKVLAEEEYDRWKAVIDKGRKKDAPKE